MLIPDYLKVLTSNALNLNFEKWIQTGRKSILTYCHCSKK